MAILNHIRRGWQVYRAGRSPKGALVGAAGRYGPHLASSAVAQAGPLGRQDLLRARRGSSAKASSPPARLNPSLPGPKPVSWHFTRPRTAAGPPARASFALVQSPGRPDLPQDRGQATRAASFARVPTIRRPDSAASEGRSRGHGAGIRPVGISGPIGISRADRDFVSADSRRDTRRTRRPACSANLLIIQYY